MCTDSTGTVRLIDGAAVTIRRLTPADYDSVIRLATDLTSEERYQRFFTVHPAYIGEWALTLTAPAEGVVALGAFETGEVIGVANYAESSEPGEAEIAVVVAHEQHDRGVGTLLLQALGRLAREGGQHRFVAEVLVENHAMRQVIRDAGWPVAQHWDGAVIQLEVDLDRVGDDGSVESGTVEA